MRSVRILLFCAMLLLFGAGLASQAFADAKKVYAWGANGNGQLGDGTNTDNSAVIQVLGLSDVVQVAGGGNSNTNSGFSLALKSDGTVWAWGENSFGQLGDGTYTDRSIPVQVSGLSGIVQVATGWRSHCFALKSDGTVWAWGQNQYGQLGDGTSTDRGTPVQVSGLTGVVQVSVGWYHSLALKSDGTVWVWGWNEYGQLGDGTFDARKTPFQITALTGIVQVAGASIHSLALKSDGTVWAWGVNTEGELGDGTTTNKKTPVRVLGLSGVAQLANGTWHSLALKSDGTLWAWGYNAYGQLGDETSTNRKNAIRVAGLSGITQVGAGGIHSLILKPDGTVWAWGYNGYGQLGDGTNISKSKPVQTLGLVGVSQVTGGGIHSLAFASEIKGQATKTLVPKVSSPSTNPLFLRATVLLKSDNSPVRGVAVSFSVEGNGVGLSLTNAEGVASLTLPPSYAVGSYAYKAEFTGSLSYASSVGISTLAITALNPAEKGKVFSWGYNYSGQLGNGALFSSNLATVVAGLTKAVQVSGGILHTLALKSDGTVWAWGDNTFSQLGDGTSTHKNTPVQVSGLSDIVQVSGGNLHSLALKSDGTVWAWGDNGYGQLGDGTSMLQSVPVQVTGLTGVVQISAGLDHSLALKSDGTVWSWGACKYGQLGDGTDVNKNTPVQALGKLKDVVQIVAGGYHSLALKSDGTVKAWGWNYYGQLGVGNNNPKKLPTTVLGLTGGISLGGGYYHSFALKSDGTLWAWGENYFGQLGDGTNTRKNAPVQISGLTGIVQITGGANHSLGLKSDGTVWAWGYNADGELGEGSNTHTNTPLQAALLTGQTYISAGGYHSLSMVSVTRNATNLSADTTYPYGSLPSLSSNLTQKDTTLPLTNREVAYTVGGTLLGSATTNASGDSLFKLTTPLALGTHKLKARFVGDSLYNPSNAYANITIAKADVTLNLRHSSIAYGATRPLEATLIRLSDTAKLPNMTVSFTLNGVSIGSATTDEKGRTALPYKVEEALALGDHTLVATFAGDSNHNTASNSIALTVIPANTALKKGSYKARHGQKMVFSSKLLRITDRQVLSGRTVTFLVDGVSIGTATTDGFGIVMLAYTIPNTLAVGEHILTAQFGGESRYLASSSITPLTVK